MCDVMMKPPRLPIYREAFGLSTLSVCVCVCVFVRLPKTALFFNGALDKVFTVKSENKTV